MNKLELCRFRSTSHPERSEGSFTRFFAFAQNDVIYQQGRSMVEMLGVLAVMGVLSVGGVAMYTNAMNKYKANELLNEASKRAVVVATRALSGQTSIPLTEFSGHSSVAGGTFADEESVDVSGNTFAIKIKGVDSAVCTQMKNSIGSNTVVREIPENCGAETISLVFNKDLLIDNSVHSNVGVSTIDGYTGNDGSTCDSETQVGTECQVCVQGEYVDSDAKCGIDQVCVDGSCTTDDRPNWNWCLKNSDCKKLEPEKCGNGECFCNFDGRSEAVDPVYGPLEKLGFCAPTAEFIESENFAGFVLGKDTDWFSAKNFCSALGKRMAALSDFNCPYTLAEYKTVDTEDELGGVCCAIKEQSDIRGEGCGDVEVLFSSFEENQSAIWNSQEIAWNTKLATMLYEHPSDTQSYWLKDLADSEQAFVVYPFASVISVRTRNDLTANSPLCK